MNPSLCHLLGRDAAGLLTTDFQSITHPDDLASDLGWFRRTLAGELEGYEIEKRYLRPDGSTVCALLSVALVRDDDGKPLYFIGQLQDTTERKQAEEELRRYSDHLNELALQDPLTGLPTYRDLHAMLDTEIERSRRYHRRWSVVLLDVDAFRSINATEGHVAGDRVLRQVAAAIEEASRASDQSARIGGDEFALLLPETAGADAERTGRRIAPEVAARTDGASVSVGVASWPDDGQSKELVLLRANMRLQAAKPLASNGAAPKAGPAGSSGIRRILSLAREQLGMDVAYVAELTPTSQVYQAVSGNADSVRVEEGARLPLDATYCHRMLEGRIPHAVPDTAHEPELSELAITTAAGIGSYVGVPLELSGGRVYGTLCCVSHSPNPEIAEGHVELMRFLAGLVSDQIERDERELTDRGGGAGGAPARHRKGGRP